MAPAKSQRSSQSMALADDYLANFTPCFRSARHSLVSESGVSDGKRQRLSSFAHQPPFKTFHCLCSIFGCVAETLFKLPKHHQKMDPRFCDFRPAASQGSFRRGSHAQDEQRATAAAAHGGDDHQESSLRNVAVQVQDEPGQEGYESQGRRKCEKWYCPADALRDQGVLVEVERCVICRRSKAAGSSCFWDLRGFCS
eukprot:783276-Rhodomonas_salina.4